jgi:hypothetical protein
MQEMRGRDQELGMKGSVDIRYMIDVGVKGGVLVMRRRIHTSERIDIPAGKAEERLDRIGRRISSIGHIHT